MAKTRYERVVVWTARWVDGRPWSLASWGERSLDRLLAERRRRASLHPRWAAIEARREAEDGTRIIRSADLTIADATQQHQIELQALPDPWTEPFARYARTHTAEATVRSWIEKRQRARRGWSDTEIWNLGHSLARRTADMLGALADEGISWPGDGEFTGPPDYERALHTKATALRTWANEPTAELDTWYDLATTRGAELEAAAAFAALTEADTARYVAAQDALRWVADHLGDLWD